MLRVVLRLDCRGLYRQSETAVCQDVTERAVSHGDWRVELMVPELS